MNKIILSAFLNILAAGEVSGQQISLILLQVSSLAEDVIVAIFISLQPHLHQNDLDGLKLNFDLVHNGCRFPLTWFDLCMFLLYIMSKFCV